MKKLIANKLASLFLTIILSLMVLVCNNSCHKGKIAENVATHIPLIQSIIYTDLNPDLVIHGAYPSQYYYLDLNKDGADDFKFEISFIPRARNGAECQPGPRFNIKVSPADSSSNAIAIEGNYPAALDSFAIINSSHRQWSVATGQTLISGHYSPGCGGSSQGKWRANVNKYLGLKLISGTKAYYGWVNLSISVSGFYSAVALTVQGYAYNSISNQPILAGQTR